MYGQRRSGGRGGTRGIGCLHGRLLKRETRQSNVPFLTADYQAEKNLCKLKRKGGGGLKERKKFLIRRKGVDRIRKHVGVRE